MVHPLSGMEYSLHLLSQLYPIKVNRSNAAAGSSGPPDHSSSIASVPLDTPPRSSKGQRQRPFTVDVPHRFAAGRYMSRFLVELRDNGRFYGIRCLRCGSTLRQHCAQSFYAIFIDKSDKKWYNISRYGANLLRVHLGKGEKLSQRFPKAMSAP
jgi:hypothetical protein